MTERNNAEEALRLVARASGCPWIVGICNCSNMVRGSFQACHVDYSIDQVVEGKGLMFEVVSESLVYVLRNLSFHGVMANHLPGK
ncbi:MAG: GNAT family N-acetyltransferase [Roseovarius sp.]|nr:GNAT family N-acetyltransferase [Roseovarius sp.]